MDKKTLQSYLAMEKELEQLEELIVRYEARIGEAKVAKYSSEPKGKGMASDAIGVNIARLESMCDMYKERCNALSDCVNKIENAIDSLDPKERMVMRGKYIEGLEWAEIAKKLEWSERHTTRLHGRILQKIKFY